jgi:hypothetical protein
LVANPAYVLSLATVDESVDTTVSVTREDAPRARLSRNEKHVVKLGGVHRGRPVVALRGETAVP